MFSQGALLSNVSFDVKSFGATGDGQTIDSGAINRAIDAAAAVGGGTVYLPAGTYASYSIHLKSHVALYLEHGATLLAAPPTAERGYDAEQVDAEIAADKAREKQLGLTFGSPSPTDPGQTAGSSDAASNSEAA